MEVEVEGEDGSKLAFGKDEEAAVFGRGCGLNTDDRTVSRRHVSFQLDHSDSEVANAARVSFQVMGKNPFWVYDGEVLRPFRKFDKGHLQLGHRFCFSANTPLWFTLNSIQPHTQLNLDEIHVSEIDPVKEFGFLVMGHEFDHYPKGMIRNVKDWEWFLEEPRKDSEDEEDFEKERRKMRGKRKIGKVNEDDEWTGDSEDDKDLVANVRKGKLPRYSTRSRDSKGGNKDTKASKSSKQKKAASVDETVEEEDDNDETLGGFIVADEDDDQDEENDEEEEEEFEDDDDEVND
ncbi:Xaa-Pro aminopeptidase pepP [Spatholobus suberectus]|nr:Xaa-Pro aminopeptidase pepP [Spatholobus suberectus]